MLDIGWKFYKEQECLTPMSPGLSFTYKKPQKFQDF